MPGSIKALYDYTDGAGKLLFQVVRFEPKGFRQRRPDGKGGWIWNLEGVFRTLYRLPNLVQAPENMPIFIVEGEKDADALTNIGLLATTTAGGAGNWNKTSGMMALDGRTVFIIADKDEPGRKHAEGLALWIAGMARSVAVFELPDLNAEMPVKDVSDWLEGQDSRDSASLAADICAMAASAQRANFAAKGPALKPPNAPLPGQPARPPQAAAPDLICLNDVKAETLKWLWPGRLPMGKVSLLFGDPGLGKSLVSIFIASLVSHGGLWPDQTECKPGGVVLLSAEDDLHDTIRPRFDAAGADPKRITILRGVREEGTDGVLYFNIARDIPVMMEAIKQTADCSLVIVDPISAYLGGADTHVNAEVRALLAPLSTLAADCKITLLSVTHMNKGGGTRALYRAMGSLAFIAAARAAWLITPDPDDAGRRFMLPAKLNLAEWPTGLAYRIGQVTLDNLGPVARVEWERDPVIMTADDALASSVVRGTHGEAERLAACEWLAKELANGEMAASDVQSHAMVANVHTRQLLWAKKELGVLVVKGGFSGSWRWSLPPGGASMPDAKTVPVLRPF